MHQNAWFMQFPRKGHLFFIWTLEMLTSPGVSSGGHGASARLVRSRLNHSRDPGSPPQIRNSQKWGKDDLYPQGATIGKIFHQEKQGSTSNKIFTMWIQKQGNNKNRWSFPKQCHLSSPVLLHYPRSNSRCHMASMGSCTYLENLDRRIHGAVLVVVGDQINSLAKDPESRTIYQVYVGTAHCSVIYYLHLPTTSCQNQKHPTHTHYIGTDSSHLP